MKKRIFAMLLALALVIAAGTVAVFAAESEISTKAGADAQSVSTDVKDAICPCGCGRKVTEIPEDEWQEWKFNTRLETGHYRLTENKTGVTRTLISETGKVLLNLNGFSITTANTYRGITIYTGGVATLIGEGTISGYAQGAGVVEICAGSTFNMYQAEIRNINTVSNDKTKVAGTAVSLSNGTSASARTQFNMYSGALVGGKIYSTGSIRVGTYCTFNMYGGTLTAGAAGGNNGNGVYMTASSSVFNLAGGTLIGTGSANRGGAVYMAGGTFTMSDGKITGFKALRGAGVFMAAGTFNMTGGEISGNTATSTGSAVDVFGTSAVFTMTGGTVTSGVTAGVGTIHSLSPNVHISGGVVNGNICSTQTVTVSGTAQIADVDLVTADKDGKAVATNLIIGADGLKDGASIGITANDGQQVFAEGTDANVAQYLYSTTGRNKFVCANGAVTLEENNYCPVCKQDMPWVEWTNGLTVGGHYYLNKDVTSGSQWTVGQNADPAEYCLDLNGYSFNKGGRAFNIYGGSTANVFSTGFNSQIIGAYVADNAGVINLDSNSNMNLYDGLTLIGNAANNGFAGNSGGVIQVNSGTFNMYGSTIIGQRANYGGAIYVKTGGTFNMYGGLIKDGTAVRGGNICIDGGTANISGGIIEDGYTDGDTYGGGNIYVQNSGKVTISGNAVIRDGYSKALSNDTHRGGGNIYVYSGTLTVNGGTIESGGTNACGGNIFSRGGSVIINGGNILNGKAGLYGGNIAVRDNTVAISGGTITGGDVAIIHDGVESFTVSGAPTIEHLALDVANSGVDTTITLGEGGVTGGSIAVNVNEGVPFSIECSDDAQIVKSSVNYFRDSNQNSDLTVGINDNNQLVLAKYATCKHCSVGDNAEKVYVWTAIQDTTLQDVYSGQKGLPEGHYYLRGNHTEDTRIVLRSLDEDSLIDSDMLCLDLNGYTYTKNGNQAFWIRKYTTLSIMDLSANKTGKMIGKFSSTSTNAYGSIAYMNADESEFNLYSGTLEYAGTGVYCGGIVGNNGGEVTINILGGKLIGGKASQNGGNIYASQAATLNISGNAIISGGTVNGETNDVQANGACTISDCAIGTVKLKGTATLSGAPVIELLDLTNAGEAAVTVNNLIADSSITVNAKRYTPFTVQNSNIAELKDYFKSCDEELLIAVNDNDQLYFYREEFKAICYCTDHYNNGNGTEITWTDIENTKFEKIDTYLRLYSGHYYLPDDFTAPERVVVQKLTGYDTSKVVVNLNGHDWKYSNKQIMPFWVRNTGATLTVCDTSTNANGRILGYAGDGAGGGVIRVTGGGQFDLRSGTLAYVGAPATASGGVLYVANGCTFNMYGGKLVGGSTTGSGAAIYADGKLNLQGGEIEQGYATINKIAEQPNKIRLAGRYAELTLNSKLYDAFAGMIHAATNVNDDEMVGVGLGLTDDGWLWYPNVETLAEAYQDGNNFIRLMPNGITDIQINGVSDYYIDINGIDNAVVNVPSDSKIFWMDTANNDFDAMISNPDYVEGGSQPEKIPDPDSCGYITADPGMAYSYAPNGKWYITVKNSDGTYSFHCLEMRLETFSIRSSVGGVYYTAVWNADTVLAGQLDGTSNYDPLITGYGIALTKGNVSINDFITKGAFTYFDNMEGLTNRFLYNTRGLEINSCVLKNIVSVNNTAEANRVNAQTKINAAPFIYFEDYTGKITTLVGEEFSSSFADMIELAAYYATDDAAKAKLQTLYESWVVGEGAYKLGEEFCATTLPGLYALLAPASESQGS